MVIIGVTGPSGAGKGVVSEILRKKYRYYTIDADKVYHKLVSSPSECLDEIKKYFGECVVDSGGALDRSVLREKVFGQENSKKLELLNQITHKHVMFAIRDEINCLTSDIPACVVDAPLLIECGFVSECDFTVSVLAPQDMRAERISKRDGILLVDAIKRISSQKQDAFYVDNTDYLITNDGDMSSLEKAVLNILRERRLVE